MKQLSDGDGDDGNGDEDGNDEGGDVDADGNEDVHGWHIESSCSLLPHLFSHTGPF